MDGKELRKMMYTAQLEGMGAFVIRYPRGRCEDKDWCCSLEALAVGKGRQISDGKDAVVLSFGPMGCVVQKAIRELQTERPDYSVAHYDMRFVKPLDTDILDDIISRFNHIVTIEDGTKMGGFGSEVSEYLTSKNYSGRLTILGIPDQFVEHGAVDKLYEKIGLDVKSVKQALL